MNYSSLVNKRWVSDKDSLNFYFSENSSLMTWGSHIQIHVVAEPRNRPVRYRYRHSFSDSALFIAMVTKSSLGVVSQLLAAGEDKVDLVSEVRLVVFKPSPGGGGAFLPPVRVGTSLSWNLGSNLHGCVGSRHMGEVSTELQPAFENSIITKKSDPNDSVEFCKIR
jgi:hypothetical protein